MSSSWGRPNPGDVSRERGFRQRDYFATLRGISLTFDSVTGATVKIKVGKGPQSKIFHVHENVLEKGSSPFFRTALKAEWKERRGCDQTIKLEHHEPNVFEAYIRWVYNGVYAIDIPDEYHLCSLVRAYVLGEEVTWASSRKNVIKLIIHRFSIESFRILLSSGC